MPGIQLPIGIDTVNPVDADYKRGPWPSIAAGKAAIPLALRYNNLSFYVVGDPNEYYWLDTDLSDSGLLIRSSSSASIPKVRYVYLVQDASDALLMGGAANNVYTTSQTAYNAANILQLALGGTDKVIIQVGNITAAIAAGVTLTADWNTNIWLAGINQQVSNFGNIVLTNATGSGRNFGTSTSLFISISNITIGTINTSATGATGNAGSFYVRTTNTTLGNTNADVTQAFNVLGNSGAINFGSFVSSGTVVGNISNRLVPNSSTGNTGEIIIEAIDGIRVGTINANSVIAGTSQGNISLINVTLTRRGRFPTKGGTIRFKNVTMLTENSFPTQRELDFGNNINLTSDLNITLDNVKAVQHDFSPPDYVGIDILIVVNTNHTGGNCIVTMTDVVGQYVQFDNVISVTAFRCSFLNLNGEAMYITGSKDITFTSSFFRQGAGGNACIFLDLTAAEPLNLTFLQCTILGGSNSIQADAPINVSSGASYYEIAVDANTTLVPLTLDA